MMKRIFALLLCVFVLANGLIASAESVLYEVEEYTWKEAASIIGEYGWEGITVDVKDCNMRFWIHEGYGTRKISDAGKEQGYLAYAYALSSKEGSPNNELYVTVRNYGVNRADFVELLKKSGMTDIRDQEINGVDAIMYTDPNQTDCICEVVSFVQEDGNVVEFTFYIEDDDFHYISSLIKASIRPMS